MVDFFQLFTLRRWQRGHHLYGSSNKVCATVSKSGQCLQHVEIPVLSFYHRRRRRGRRALNTRKWRLYGVKQDRKQIFLWTGSCWLRPLIGAGCGPSCAPLGLHDHWFCIVFWRGFAIYFTVLNFCSLCGVCTVQLTGAAAPLLATHFAGGHSGHPAFTALRINAMRGTLELASLKVCVFLYYFCMTSFKSLFMQCVFSLQYLSSGRCLCNTRSFGGSNIKSVGGGKCRNSVFKIIPEPPPCAYKQRRRLRLGIFSWQVHNNEGNLQQICDVFNTYVDIFGPYGIYFGLE